jgi:hypothetical protein
MPSQSLVQWRIQRLPSLEVFEIAHAAVGGTSPGRRYATQHINQAYAMLLSSQFQGFCRDLHSECIDALANSVRPSAVQNILRIEFLSGRKLETGNPNPGNLGSDFNRFGLKLFDEMVRHNPQTPRHKKGLESLNVWRNAIGHSDFNKPELGGKATIRLVDVRTWRSACGCLATSMDNVMRQHLRAILGISPW